METIRKRFIKTVDGSVWEVVKETKKEFEVKSRFKIFISKRLVVEDFYREVSNYATKKTNSRR